MKLVNIHGANDVRIDNSDRPQPGSNDILLKLDACGICGSDLSFAKHGFLRPGGAPWPLGHEAAGTVVECGADVSDIKLGLRVLINPMGDAANIIGNGGSEGAFAEFLVIRNAKLGQHILAIPDTLSAETAALVEPLSVSLHGIQRATLQASDKVAVFGAGPIGLGAIIWLKQQGFNNAVAIDICDARLALAKALGAGTTINPSTENLSDALIAAHGTAAPVMGGATCGTDVFLDMAGAPQVLNDIISTAKFQARIVVTAVYAQPVSLDMQLMLMKELSLCTAVGYPDELPDVLQQLQNIPDTALQTYVTHRLPFAQFMTAFDTAKQSSSGKVMVYF